ncbi:MAG: hypothetical protein H6818_02380 [Phycisphaerales bacterium]|nr:hypothetical protein [Phycisphaerales bacterium]MCB9863161.1 hypothetical protein [Phycisphaerales bacterium]
MKHTVSMRVWIAPAVLFTLLFITPTRNLMGQSILPALFVTDSISTAPQFGNFASVRSFTVALDGTLTPVGTYFTNDDPYELALSPSGRYLAVGHASALTNEDLIIFTVNPDASLTMYAVVTVQSSPFEIEWLDDETLIVLETRNGNSGVWTYRFDESAAQPQKILPIDDARTGVFSTNLKLHPTLPVVYVPDSPQSGTNSLRAFNIAPDGTLSLLQQLTVSPYALDIDMTRDGKYLYMVSGGGSDSIQGFEVDQVTGMLSPLPFSPFITPDGPPSDIVVSPGGVAVVFHGATERVRSFLVSADDGTLFDSGFGFSIGGFGIFESIQLFSNYLLVTRNHSLDLEAGILEYSLMLDGSMIPIGDGDPVFAGTRPYFMEVWNPSAVQFGDINADGAVDLLDIPPFAAALVGEPMQPVHVTRSDINQDGDTDGLDVGPFVQAILSPVASGACCFTDAPCLLVSEEECTNVLGGTFGGVGIPCSVCPAVPAPTIEFVFSQTPPFCNDQQTTYQFIIFGDHFSTQADVRFVHDSLPDILPVSSEVFDPMSVGADFDFTGAPAGIYQLRLTNPDGQFVDSPDNYEIAPCN